jgi:hypothetical protein
MSKNFLNKVGQNRLESVFIKNSGHLEQFDRAITEEGTMMFVSPMMSGVTRSKKEGSNVEFHEYLGLLWLEYLWKIGHHDNTFDPSTHNSTMRDRINQFRPLL